MSWSAKCSGLVAAYLAVAVKLYGRGAKDFYSVQTRLGGSVDDPASVVAYLLACEAALLFFHPSHVIQNGCDTICKGLTFLLGLKISSVFPEEDDGAATPLGRKKLAN
jgi:hypothetical protein